MADKLMQDVDEIKSSSESESITAQQVDEERMKKEEIMANLKHLNMLGSGDPGTITSPSEVPDINSNISRKDNPSSPTSDNVYSGTYQQNKLNEVKEPSISSDSGLEKSEDEGADRHFE